MEREETMKFSLFFLPITLHSRSVLVAIIPISRSSLGPAFALLTCSVLASMLWENDYSREAINEGSNSRKNLDRKLKNHLQ